MGDPTRAALLLEPVSAVLQGTEKTHEMVVAGKGTVFKVFYIVKRRNFFHGANPNCISFQ